MARGVPIQPEMRAQIIELAKAGMGRNAIARQTGVSAASVTRVCEPEGIVFDWASTDLATAARRVQVGEMRTNLAHAALQRAGEALEAMAAPHDEVHWQAATDHQSGGWKRYKHATPSASDQRNYATIFGILTQRAADLLRSSAGGGANADAVSVLGSLGESLIVAAAALQDVPASDPTEDPVIVGRDEMIAELEADLRDLPDEDESGATS